MRSEPRELEKAQSARTELVGSDGAGQRRQLAGKDSELEQFESKQIEMHIEAQRQC
jgi:hypothetical protein